MADNSTPAPTTVRRARPFRQAVLRGLGVVLPPLLTVALFFWAWSLVQHYVLSPIESSARYFIVEAIWDVESPPTAMAKGTDPGVFTRNSQQYRILPRTNEGVPTQVAERVSRLVDLNTASAQECYAALVRAEYLQPIVVVPIFLCLFLILLYLLGKLLAARAGRMLWNMIERTITRLPIIRNVYSSVKQVTDFIFKERGEVEYTRVVAVEYPRRGVWSIGFVTGESMLAIRQRAQEPVLSVLMPTSPMPATGFIITVPRSHTLDLNITVDQAIQFVVSCGVVVPSTQTHDGDPSQAEQVQKMIEQVAGDEKSDEGPGETSGGNPTPSAAS
jgi:uncharacterized membrane protein